MGPRIASIHSSGNGKELARLLPARHPVFLDNFFLCAGTAYCCFSPGYGAFGTGFCRWLNPAPTEPL